MTTKPPSTVKPALEKSMETIAYKSVADIPTVEQHDQDRLGYNIWRWLTQRRDSLEVVVKTSGSRLLITEEEAIRKIRGSLRQQGIEQ